MNAQNPEVPTAIVAAGDEETRVLLRGLLRLHHVRVEGEAEGAGTAADLLSRTKPSLLVLDVNLTDGSWSDLVVSARQANPSLRVILVAPSSRPAPASIPPSAPDVVLLRPFRIRQFADALGPAPVGRPAERLP